jgi:hypothetical protein
MSNHALHDACYLAVLATDVADAAVRSEVELFAYELRDENGHPMFDTRQGANSPADLQRVNAAIAYIERRGTDAFPWQMKRRLDAPTLVQFFDKEDPDER